MRTRTDALDRLIGSRLETAAGRVERSAALLALLSPESTVARGYAIVRDAEEGTVIPSAEGIGAGRRLFIGLRDGRIPVRVEEGVA